MQFVDGLLSRIPTAHETPTVFFRASNSDGLGPYRATDATSSRYCQRVTPVEAVEQLHPGVCS